MAQSMTKRNQRRRQRYRDDPEYRERVKAQVYGWRQTHPDKVVPVGRDVKLRSKFGITLAEYESMLEQQGGVCAICGQPETGKRLAVDHDHKTGKVRGLLCGQCNRGLGYLKDDVAVLSRAIEYLTEAA